MRKNNYLMLVMASVVLSFALMLGGCGGPDAKEVIEKDISQTFDALVVKEGDAYENMKATFVDNFTSVPGVDGAELFNALLDGFNYSIDSIDVDDESGTAVAKLTIKVKSMSDIFSAWLSDLAKVDTSTFDGMSEDEMAEYTGKLLTAAASAAEVHESSIEIHYGLNKDGGWDLAEGENLASLTEAMLGDLSAVDVVPEEDGE